ncbi:MAG: (E)-4-hydroxy-3-methylbut-2-enyl-diphosphate synthase [Bacteroidota bacterium]
MITHVNYISRVLQIGGLKLGGSERIRIQSMTNTPTMDTEASFRQIMDLHEAGCELVRLTARNISEAENIGVIRTMLENRGIFVPLAADIHFNPLLAERAAEIVHKIRINPGNYFDQQHFLAKAKKQKASHAQPELIREGINRLTDICRKNNTVIRVGVNHGSLSDRILQQYGNTAEGMIASAMEFLNICRNADFHDLVVSMKSSHVQTMVKASIGMVNEMMQAGMDYPVHLGVTEAGEGEDGRVRSAAGIGPLLALGIGDTIRVSLTEDPVAEIPVAKCLADMYQEERGSHSDAQSKAPHRIFDHKKTKVFGIIGGSNPIAVVGNAKHQNDTELQPDLILDEHKMLTDREGREYPALIVNGPEDLESYIKGKTDHNAEIIFLFTVINGNIAPVSKMFDMLVQHKCSNPVVIKLSYAEEDTDTLLLRSSSDLSTLILRKYGNAYCLENDESATSKQVDIVYAVLQATGVRITGTEYISCPGCGRTEFDIQQSLRKIKEHTQGMKNIKIAVMGCIVNGPGEMADADFGYVGSGKGKVSLYHSGEVVKKNIPEEDALTELLELINARHR